MEITKKEQEGIASGVIKYLTNQEPALVPVFVKTYENIISSIYDILDTIEPESTTSWSRTLSANMLLKGIVFSVAMTSQEEVGLVNNNSSDKFAIYAYYIKSMAIMLDIMDFVNFYTQLYELEECKDKNKRIRKYCHDLCISVNSDMDKNKIDHISTSIIGILDKLSISVKNTWTNGMNPISKVSRLKKFPYKTHKEFVKAVQYGDVEIATLDHSFVKKWSMNGMYHPTGFKWLLYFLLLGSHLHLSIILAVVGFTTGMYWLILSFVVLYLVMFLSMPTMKNLANGPFNNGFLMLIIRWIPLILLISLILGFIYQISYLIIISTASFIVSVSSNYAVYSPMKELQRKMTEHEDLVCMLWNNVFMSLSVKSNKKNVIYSNNDIIID
jgi:hypothetical protein